MYFLHLRDKSVEEQLTADIQKLGQKVHLFLTNDVKVVVTDYSALGALLASERKKGPVPLEDGQCPAVTVTSSNESTSAPRIGASSSNYIYSRLRNKMKKAPEEESKNDPLNKIPRILREAHGMGLKITRCSEFLQQLAVQKRKNKSLFLDSLAPAKRCMSDAKKRTVFRLTEPFIKLEHRSKQYRPVFETLSAWPRINANADRKGCIFAQERGKDAGSKSHSSLMAAGASPKKKKRKAARKLDFELLNPTKQPAEAAKVMMATDSKVLGEGRETRPGFCELCNVNTDNIMEHLASEEHKKSVNSDVYKRLDEEIAKGPTFDQFLATCLHRSFSGKTGPGTPCKSPRPSRPANQNDSLPSPSRLQLVLPPPLCASSPQGSFKSPLRPFKSPLRPFKSPLRPFKSPLRSFKSPQLSFKSPRQSFKSPLRSADGEDSASPIYTYKQRRESASPIYTYKQRRNGSLCKPNGGFIRRLDLTAPFG